MRKIKYGFSLLLIILIMISSLAMPVSAAEVNYSVTGASGAKGDTVTVSVKISSGVQIWGANVSLGFNSSELQYVSSAQGGAVSGGSLVNRGSAVNFSGMLSSKSGTVFTVKFKILKSSGTSTLTLSSSENTDYDGKVHSCSASGNKITVVKSVTGISLNKTSVTLKKGETVSLSATVSPSDATNRNVTYTTSNSKVATVSGSGKITAVGGGTAKITAKAGGKSATCTVNVTVKQTGIAVSGGKNRSVGEGNTLKLSVAKVPSDATDKYSVAWSSSDNSVATVSANGTVTGVKQGTAVITAVSNGWQAVYNITVTEKTSETESTSDGETSEEPSSEESTTANVTENTAELSSAGQDGEKSENKKSLSERVKGIYGKVFDKNKTVTKGYHYIMLVTVGLVTAGVAIPVTALVTSNICKKKNKNKNENEIEYRFIQK